MKNVFSLAYKAIYFQFCSFYVLCLVLSMTGSPYWIPIGVIFVLWLFESAMQYDEFKNTHGKVVELCDEASTVKNNDEFIKKDGKWL